MNIVDILILILLLIYTVKGFKNGAIKELVTFVGGLAVIVIAYMLKNPISIFMYENMPFMNFGGILSGISVLNIIVYELLAFLLVAGLLLFIYKLIISFTNVIETILKATVILEIPSKIIGLIVGFIEGVVVVFILLFVMMQFNVTRDYIRSSKLSENILTKTPILGNATSAVYNSLQEIYTLADTYKDSPNRDQVNLEALDILLKYKLIDTNNARVLVDTGKLTMPGVEDVINKYN